MREGRDAWMKTARFIAKRARQQREAANELATENARLQAAVDQALVEHSRLEAERARLACEAAGLRRDRDTARAQLAALESDRTRLCACAEEQGEARLPNGFALVRQTDLHSLRNQPRGADPATVRLLHELLDRLLVTGSEVRA